MFDYKDFTPEVIAEGGWFHSHKLEDLKDVVAAANQWAIEKSVEVINIETALLPVTTKDPLKSLAATSISVELGTAKWTQMVRLWFRKQSG